MRSPLIVERSKYQFLRERLLAEWPTLDEETLRDTLEGITSLQEMIAVVIRSSLVDQALQAGLRSRIEDMKERLARLEGRGDKKRQLAFEAMNESGLTKLEEPDFTASIRHGSPAVVVVTEQDIPGKYWVPQPAKLDRQAVLAELKQGVEISGVHLSNAHPALSVRTK